MHMKISSLFVDFCLTYVRVFQGSTQGGSQHEIGGLVWDDVEGQESFPVSAGFELTTRVVSPRAKLLSHHTHTPHT